MKMKISVEVFSAIGINPPKSHYSAYPSMDGFYWDHQSELGFLIDGIGNQRQMPKNPLKLSDGTVTVLEAPLGFEVSRFALTHFPTIIEKFKKEYYSPSNPFHYLKLSLEHFNHQLEKMNEEIRKLDPEAGILGMAFLIIAFEGTQAYSLRVADISLFIIRENNIIFSTEDPTLIPTDVHRYFRFLRKIGLMTEEEELRQRILLEELARGKDFRFPRPGSNNAMVIDFLNFLEEKDYVSAERIFEWKKGIEIDGCQECGKSLFSVEPQQIGWGVMGELGPFLEEKVWTCKGGDFIVISTDGAGLSDSPPSDSPQITEFSEFQKELSGFLKPDMEVNQGMGEILRIWNSSRAERVKNEDYRPDGTVMLIKID